MSLTAATRFDACQPRPEMVISVLSLSEYPSEEPRLDEIVRAVCVEFHMKPHAIRSHRRDIDVLRARAVFYRAARELTSKSLPQIGGAVNRTHHAVLHGLKQVRDGRFVIDAVYAGVLEALGRGVADTLGPKGSTR